MDTSSPAGHIPVLLPAVLKLASLKPGMRVIDATLGGGSYTRAFMEAIGEDGHVMAFDWDVSALEHFREQALRDPFVAAALATERLTLVNQPYSALPMPILAAGWKAPDVIVADLGLSSLQLSNPERGLSFQQDGPLDMRLNSQETVTAADLVNQWREADLAELFRVYGDEGEAERIARAIVETRRKKPLLRTLELATLVKANVVPARRSGRIHPATKVFQALRMAVNSEWQHLELFVKVASECLAPGGRLLMVTFHSGEDTLVKHALQALVKSGGWELLTKKPIVPDNQEVYTNPRSRSAKLRGIQKMVFEQ